MFDRPVNINGILPGVMNTESTKKTLRKIIDTHFGFLFSYCKFIIMKTKLKRF